MLTGSDPFEHQDTASSSRAGQLAGIHTVLGPFPAHFQQRCARAAEYLDADGEQLFAMSGGTMGDAETWDVQETCFTQLTHPGEGPWKGAARELAGGGDAAGRARCVELHTQVSASGPGGEADCRGVAGGCVACRVRALRPHALRIMHRYKQADDDMLVVDLSRFVSLGNRIVTSVRIP